MVIEFDRLALADRSSSAPAGRSEATPARYFAAQEVLDWKPRTPLKEGLGSTIAYFDRLLSDQKLRAQL